MGQNGKREESENLEQGRNRNADGETVSKRTGRSVQVVRRRGRQRARKRRGFELPVSLSRETPPTSTPLSSVSMFGKGSLEFVYSRSGSLAPKVRSRSLDSDLQDSMQLRHEPHAPIVTTRPLAQAHWLYSPARDRVTGPLFHLPQNLVFTSPLHL